MSVSPAPLPLRSARAVGRGLVRTLRILLRLPRFAVFFTWQLVRANVRVAIEVATPGYSMTAAIVRFETRSRSDVEAMLLANAITLTPGTISLEIEPDTRAIHVHGLYVEDRAAFVADLARMEDEILRVVR